MDRRVGTRRSAQYRHVPEDDPLALLQTIRGLSRRDGASPSAADGRVLGTTARALVARSLSPLCGRHPCLIDTVGIVAAAWIGMAMRYDAFAGLELLIPHAILLTLVLLSIRLIVNIQLGLYAQDWRFASVPDLQRIVAAGLIAT